MPSINEISIAVNSIFLDIVEPMTFNLNKNSLFTTYKKLYFRFDASDGLEFSMNPIFRFDSTKLLNDFLEREKQLSLRFQEFEIAADLKNLINEKGNTDNLDNFYLNYSIEINEDEVHVFFNTNSLVFKYEMIG